MDASDPARSPGCASPVPPGEPRYWRTRWARLKAAQAATKAYGDSRQFWDDKQKVQAVFFRDADGNRQKTEDRLAAMAIPPGSRVLDIGSGPGRLAIPLARSGCTVTAVEPSPVMREALADNIRESGVSGITIIPKRWEDVTSGDLGEPYDAVIASYSLTMADIGEALEKMHACCRGTVHLFWFLTPPSWGKVNRDLWPLIHGAAFPGEPTADWLWQALCEMGIYANLSVEPGFPSPVYRDLGAALEEFRRRLNCTDAAQEAIVRDYLERTLRKDGETLVLDARTFGAHIWWNVAEQA